MGSRGGGNPWSQCEGRMLVDKVAEVGCKLEVNEKHEGLLLVVLRRNWALEGCYS